MNPEVGIDIRTGDKGCDRGLFRTLFSCLSGPYVHNK